MCNNRFNMTTYTVKKGQKYPTPRLWGVVGDRLEFDFILQDSWNQLYLSEDNSTHKICGVSDLFGSNSFRPSVRRRPKEIEAVVAVPYIHSKGKIICGEYDRRFLYEYNKRYKSVVEKSGDYWVNHIYEVINNLSVRIGTCDYKLAINGPRRLSGPYIEVGSQPSLWDIKTEIEIIK